MLLEHTASSSDHATPSWAYTISVQLESAMNIAGTGGTGHISASPFTAEMTPSVTSGEYTFAVVSGIPGQDRDALRSGIAGQVMAFRVTGRDAFNNVITECVDSSLNGVGDAYPRSQQIA